MIWIYAKGTDREMRFKTREEFDAWNEQWGGECVAFGYTEDELASEDGKDHLPTGT